MYTVEPSFQHETPKQLGLMIVQLGASGRKSVSG